MNELNFPARQMSAKNMSWESDLLRVESDPLQGDERSTTTCAAESTAESSYETSTAENRSTEKSSAAESTAERTAAPSKR